MNRRELMITAALTWLAGPAAAHTASAPQWSPMLADIHRRTFRYFWETTPADTGLAPDRWPSNTFSSIAAIGFALTAYCIGVHSGYVSRGKAAKRTLTTLRTLWNSPQGDGAKGFAGHQGFFYHFLGLQTRLRYGRCELSSVDTTMLMLGVLTVAAFFDRKSHDESEIRKLAHALYERVNWRFFERESGLLSMGWDPETGFNPTTWSGYDEGMMIYLLAIGSPTHPLPAKSWQAWCSTYDLTWGPNFGKPHLGFAPLMGHQYTEVWYDMRGIADGYMRRKGSDYFTNSRLATLAQRNYAILNPYGYRDYGPNIWGLAPCDGPVDAKVEIGGREIQFHSYSARGPAPDKAKVIDAGLAARMRKAEQTGWHLADVVDDGTIAPTAAISSIVFAPEVCLPAIAAMLKEFGKDIYGRYGFHDSFNPTYRTDHPSKYGRQTPRAGWVANDYLGLDQGPILAMLENYRSGFVWNLLRNDPYVGAIIKRGLLLAGFKSITPQGSWLETGAG